MDFYRVQLFLFLFFTGLGSFMGSISMQGFTFQAIQFKADRLQMIVVAKNLSVLQLFISRMPKMCAILQLVSAPLNPIPIAEHFRRSHPQCEHSYGQHKYMSKENNAK